MSKKTKKMIEKGKMFLIASLIVTLALFLLGQRVAEQPLDWYYLGQLCGVLGIFGISAGALLTLRHPKLEQFFGGLDTIYKLHHIIGGTAFLFIVNHPLFFVLAALPTNLLSYYLLPNTSIPNTVGIIALYSLILLIFLTLFVDLPYKLWKKTHEWMGFVIILAGLHYFLQPSVLATYTPLRIWLLGWSVTAIIATLYKRWLYYQLSSHTIYKIASTVTDGKNARITLIPTEQPLITRSGQFVFVTLGNSRDEHPFSIIENSDTGLIIGCKIVGPFTLALSQAENGTAVTLRGPFGSFGENASRASEMVWIAGGIGITPFISMAAILKPNQLTTLIYTTHNNESTPFDTDVISLAKYSPTLKTLRHFSSENGRLTAEKIQQMTKYTLEAHFFLCGPIQMMEAITEQLIQTGIPRKHIIYEDFALK